MKRILLASAAALALTVVTPIAFAQTDDAPGMAGPGVDDESGPPPTEPDAHQGHGGMIGPPPGLRHGPPPPRAAHFRLDVGDERVDVKCADGEPMRACADIVLQILDRILGEHPSPPHGGPDGGGSPPPRPPDGPGPKT
jgi:hypothetical protein